VKGSTHRKSATGNLTELTGGYTRAQRPPLYRLGRRVAERLVGFGISISGG